jgi:hypothetical protein
LVGHRSQFSSVAMFLRSFYHLHICVRGAKNLTSWGRAAMLGCGQAISMKETVLIEVLSSAPLSRSETTDHTAVRHVSPRTEGVSEETIHGGVDDDDDIGSRDGLNLKEVKITIWNEEIAEWFFGTCGQLRFARNNARELDAHA